jgi:hypothetical protein
MATITKGYTFASGQVVTETNLNQLVDSATISNIATGDIADGAITNIKIAAVDAGKVTTGTLSVDRIANNSLPLTKLAAGALPSTVTVNSGNITNLSIVDADIANAANINDTKLATISTGGKVANSATTATSANTASAIVARDASGNFSAGTITASFSGNVTGNVTGTASAIADGSVSTAKIVDANVTLAKLVTAVQQALVPAGAVQAFAMNSAPAGWLAADGANVSRSTYAALFSAIGTTYGAGDGSTTFALPDLRGIFVRGSGSQTISGITYNKTFAAKEGDAFQGHRHEINASAGDSPTGNGGIIDGPAGGDVSGFVKDVITDGTNGAPRTASETRPANIALLYCIKF